MVQESTRLAPAPSEHYGHSDQVFEAVFEFNSMDMAPEAAKGLCKFGLLFRSWLLMLLAVLSTSSSASGKVIQPGLKMESLFKKTYAGCLTQKDSKLPQTVRVNISIINTNQDASVGPDVSSRSLAPWDYRIDEDHNRFPELIADAKCRHSRCVNLDGQLDHRVNSVPIKQEILVLRRERKGCHQSYRLEKKIITVGCTCVTPLIQYQA
ncbi:interleukin-17F [Tyto alba]|uniref:interleukin-17F n=1 Tax=Tyto alba TaxID=56313 RepID=UPI001C668741|nr:interleukin-17F [Tyto alba]